MIRLLAALAILFSLPAAAMATEEPSYDVVETFEGGVEIREYAGYIVAEVTVEGDRRRAQNAAFRPLFNYISGQGRAGAEIDMTTPVTAQASIDMTAPVTSEAAGEDRWTVAFIMPAQWTMETLPEPADARVSLREVPARRLAVIRFSGIMNDNRAARGLAELERVIAEQGLSPVSDPVYASYDPPWTVPWARRNEIMIEIAGAAASP